MSFQTEFPDFPAADMPELLKGFVDASWRNEPCPAFHNEELNARLFIGYADPDKREFPDAKRFILLSWEDDSKTLCETDDWPEMVAAIDRLAVGREYESVVGYNPFEDCPTLTTEEVRRTLFEFKSEMTAAELSEFLGKGSQRHD